MTQPATADELVLDFSDCPDLAPAGPADGVVVFDDAPPGDGPPRSGIRLRVRHAGTTPDGKRKLAAHADDLKRAHAELSDHLIARGMAGKWGDGERKLAKAHGHIGRLLKAHEQAGAARAAASKAGSGPATGTPAPPSAGEAHAARLKAEDDHAQAAHARQKADDAERLHHELKGKAAKLVSGHAADPAAARDHITQHLAGKLARGERFDHSDAMALDLHGHLSGLADQKAAAAAAQKADEARREPKPPRPPRPAERLAVAGRQPAPGDAPAGSSPAGGASPGASGGAGDDPAGGRRLTADELGGKGRLVPKQITNKAGRKQTVMVRPDEKTWQAGEGRGGAADAPTAPVGAQASPAGAPTGGAPVAGAPGKVPPGGAPGGAPGGGPAEPDRPKPKPPTTEEQANAVLPYKVKESVPGGAATLTTSTHAGVDHKKLTDLVRQAQDGPRAVEGVAKALGRPLTAGEIQLADPAKPGKLEVTPDGGLAKRTAAGVWTTPDRFEPPVFAPTPPAPAKPSGGDTTPGRPPHVEVKKTLVGGHALHVPVDEAGRPITHQHFTDPRTAELVGQAVRTGAGRSKLEFDRAAGEWVVSRMGSTRQWAESRRYRKGDAVKAEHHLRLDLEGDLHKAGLDTGRAPEGIPVPKHTVAQTRVGTATLFHAAGPSGVPVGEYYQDRRTADLHAEALSRGLANVRLRHDGQSWQVERFSGGKWGAVKTVSGDNPAKAERHFRKQLRRDIAQFERTPPPPAAPATPDQLDDYYAAARRAASPWRAAAKGIAGAVLRHAGEAVSAAYRRARDRYGPALARAIVAAGFTQSARGQSPRNGASGTSAGGRRPGPGGSGGSGDPGSPGGPTAPGGGDPDGIAAAAAAADRRAPGKAAKLLTAIGGALAARGIRGKGSLRIDNRGGGGKGGSGKGGSGKGGSGKGGKGGKGGGANHATTFNKATLVASAQFLQSIQLASGDTTGHGNTAVLPAGGTPAWNGRGGAVPGAAGFSADDDAHRPDRPRHRLTRRQVRALGRMLMEEVHAEVTRAALTRADLHDAQDRHDPDAAGWAKSGWKSGEAGPAAFAGESLAGRVRSAPGSLSAARAGALVGRLEAILPAGLAARARVADLEVYPDATGTQRRADTTQGDGVKNVKGFYDRDRRLMAVSVVGADCHNFYHELAHALDHLLGPADWVAVASEWPGGRPENFARAFAAWCMARRAGTGAAREFDRARPVVAGIVARLADSPDADPGATDAVFGHPDQGRDERGRWAAGSAATAAPDTATPGTTAPGTEAAAPPAVALHPAVPGRVAAGVEQARERLRDDTHASLVRSINAVAEAGFDVPGFDVKADFKKFQEVHGKDWSRFPAMVNDGDNGKTLFINSAYFTIRKATERIAEGHASGWMSSGHPDHYFRHELGHILHGFAGAHEDGDELTGRRADGPFRDPADRATAAAVSRRAADTPLEFVAEVFAGRLAGTTYSPPVTALYRRLGGPEPRPARTPVASPDPAGPRMAAPPARRQPGNPVAFTGVFNPEKHLRDARGQFAPASGGGDGRPGGAAKPVANPHLTEPWAGRAIGGAVAEAFPDRPVHYDGYTYAVGLPGDRELQVSESAAGKRAVFVFANLSGDKFASGQDLKAGTLAFVHGLKGLAENLARRDVEVCYGTPSDRRRAQLYTKTLAAAGFTPDRVSADGVSHYWVPTARVPVEQRGEKLAAYQDRLKTLPLVARHAAGRDAPGDGGRATFPADFADRGDLDPAGRWLTVAGNRVHVTAAGVPDAGGPPAVRRLFAGGSAASGSAAPSRRQDEDDEAAEIEKELALADARRAAPAGPAPAAEPAIEAGPPNEHLPAAARPDLSQAERRAVRAYTDQDYSSLNRALRRDGTPPANKADLHAALRSALDKAEPLDPPVVAGRVMTLDPDRLAPFLDAARAAAASGGDLQLGGYVSTTVDPNFKPDPTANVVMTIRAVRGLDTQPYSATADAERELLLDHRSRFRVTGVERVGGKWHVRMDQTR